MPASSLLWFPSSVPGDCTPAQLRARLLAKQAAYQESQDDATARIPQPPPEAPPSAGPIVIPRVGGRGVVRRAPPTAQQPGGNAAGDLLTGLVNGRLPSGVRKDLRDLIDSLADALYDTSIINNPDAFSFSSASRGLAVTPGAPVMVADNASGTKPLVVRIKADADLTGGRHFLFAAGYSQLTNQQIVSTIAKFDVAPTITIVLNTPGQIWVDGTPSAGNAQLFVNITSFVLDGKRAVYPR